MLVPTWRSIQGTQPTGPKLDRHEIGHKIVLILGVNHVTMFITALWQVQV